MGMGLKIMNQKRESYQIENYLNVGVLIGSKKFTHCFTSTKNNEFILTNAVNNLENCR